MRRTNLSTYMIQCCNLVKAGYGSLAEIQQMDSPEFLDCLEFEEISNQITEYKMRENRG